VQGQRGVGLAASFEGHLLIAIKPSNGRRPSPPICMQVNARKTRAGRPTHTADDLERWLGPLWLLTRRKQGSIAAARPQARVERWPKGVLDPIDDEEERNEKEKGAGLRKLFPVPSRRARRMGQK
jgi:hypothetical protein